MKLNLIECCMMEASGELSHEASQRLHRYLSMHPRARREFDVIKSQLDAVRNIPHAELSAAGRAAIPMKIKAAVRKKIDARARAKAARRRWKFVSYLTVGVSSAAAAVILFAAVVMLNRAATPQTARDTRMAGVADRLALLSDRPTQDDQEISSLQDSVSQLSTEPASAVANVDNREMANVLNALAMVPVDDPDTDTQ